MFRPRHAALALCLAAAPAMAQETITAHGISPFGELKYPADFEHFDYVNPDAPQGGTMSFRGTLASGTFDSLNYYILKGERAQGLPHIHDPLLAEAFDEPASFYGLIAESLEYPEDRAWVIFNLRPEARFSDGHPITAEDVVWTIDTLKTEAEPYWQITLEDVESAEALDDHRVRVTFAEDAATRDLAATVGQLFVLPKHYYQDVPFNESTLEPPVSSGWFRVEEVDPGRSITYCKDPDYWGADLPVNVGKNNFDCYVYEYFSDTTAAFEALKVGEYLLHEEFQSSIWATSYDFPALDAGWIVREEIPDGRSSGAQGFYMNLRRDKFRDVRVREAIAMMFNFEWTNKTLFHGLYNRSDSFWENSDLQAEGVPEGAELAALEAYRGQLPEDIFTEPAVSPPEWSADSKIDRQAVRRAGRLLNAAGWTVGPDGMRQNADGDPLTVEIVSDSAAFERVLLPYIENMRRVGIDAIYTRVDAAEEVQRQEEFDFDIMIARIVLPLRPSTELRTVFGSKGAKSPGTLNLAGVSDPAVDGLIEEIIAAETLDEMTAHVKALDRVLRAKHIWVPNWYKGSHWLAYWDVFGKPETKPPYTRGVDYWWWDQEKYEALVAEGALN
ncbi:extracellular solute-binding protein [Psychromarinibacter sp. C21-152]|uniref:Extracellular solute-binding protein n=1 Tax=Psychromarinibacter sediminicola TaxID=3033385 RepID=A0AAE3NXH1_9RHOB|nr:extracellular solute-binding protein [Psychromarinibacter sediminicola]MDF0603449.1 extracellular solute-binding protein [Psychromarinibacter sediminicola]